MGWSPRVWPPRLRGALFGPAKSAPQGGRPNGEFRTTRTAGAPLSRDKDPPPRRSPPDTYAGEGVTNPQTSRGAFIDPRGLGQQSRVTPSLLAPLVGMTGSTKPDTVNRRVYRREGETRAL